MGLSKANAQACPNDFLGPDISETVCASDFVNLENFFPELNTYVSVLWSPANTDPVSAPPGNYILSVVNAEGCIDQANIQILAEPRPAGFQDKTVQICEGQTKDLTNVFTNLGNYLVDWGTSNPQAAPPGTYVVTIQTQDGNQCTFEATITVEVVPSVNGILPSIRLFSAGGPQSGSFTTNAFRTITVDRFGGVWAGTTGGGIYYFNGQQWAKKDAADNRTYREIVVPDVFSDGPRVWAATTGDNTPAAISGGLHYLQGIGTARKIFTNIRYRRICFSPFGVRVVDDSMGGTESRFATSITRIGNVLYAGFSQNTDTELDCNENTEFYIKEGGLYKYDYTLNLPRWTKVENIFTRNEDIKITAVGTRGMQVWAGFQNWCIENGASCGTPFISIHDAQTGLPGSVIDMSNSPLPLNGNPIIRAIFTDSRGRTFVGLSGGAGIGILDENNVWHLITSDNSKLPPGASVNFNAMAEGENGRVFIGTTGGLLEYTGTGSFTTCTSYRLYTTASGLPSNNITDIAYSSAEGLMWATSDAGVCSFGAGINAIRGSVYNIFCGKPGEITSEMQGTPLAGLPFQVFNQGGSQIYSDVTKPDGSFYIEGLASGVQYKLKFTYTSPAGRTYTYEYENVSYNQLIGTVPIPDGLLTDILLLIPKLREECPDLSLPLGLPSVTPVCFDQFNMDGAADAYAPFNVVVKDNHMKRVNNLVAYYFLLQAFETSTKNIVKFSVEIGTSGADAIESLFKAGDISLKWKMYGTNATDNAEKVAKENSENLSITLEFMLVPVRLLKALFLNQGNQEYYTIMKKMEDVIKGVGDIVAKAIIDKNFFKGAATAAQGMAVDLLKKTIGIGFSKLMLLGVQQGYQSVIDQAADKCALYVSPFDYLTLHDSLINNDNLSAVLNEMEAIRLNTLSGIEAIRAFAKIAELVQKYAKIAGAVAKAGGILAAFAEGVEIIAKVAQPALHFSAAVTGFVGIDQTKDKLSLSVNESALQRSIQLPQREDIFRFLSFNVDPSLATKKNLCNQALARLRNTVITNDQGNYYTRLDDVLFNDSAYQRALAANHSGLNPYLENALTQVQGFESTYRDYTNKYYIRKQQYNFALYNLLMAYQVDSLRTTYAPKIAGTIDTLILLNDSALLGLNNLSSTINANNIAAPAYVVVDKIEYNYQREPSKPGSVTVTYRNAGNATCGNLRVMFERDTIMPLHSPDSVFIGNLNPGQSQTVTWSFTTPAVDTSVTFEVITVADNGLFNDAIGVISAFTKNGRSFTVKNGNWSDPATWSTEEVPDSNTEVQILHRVNVDINGICKSLYSEDPGNLIINTGRNLTIVK